MPTVGATAIKSLITEIANLEAAIENIGKHQRAKLNDINLQAIRTAVVGAAPEFDPANWNQKPESEQNQLLGRLTAARDSLQNIMANEGPYGPKHMMYSEYAANGHIFLLAVFGFVGILGLLMLINASWKSATGTAESYVAKDTMTTIEHFARLKKEEDGAKAKLSQLGIKLEQARESKNAEEIKKSDEAYKKQQILAADASQKLDEPFRDATNAIIRIRDETRKGPTNEADVLSMVILLGTLGGMIHLVGSLVMYVGNRQLKRSWVLYYLSMPVTGAALAPIIYMLLRIGILSPTNSGGAGSSISNLNLIAIYAFAALTGLFSKEASDKLAEIFKNLFRSEPKTKDPATPDKAKVAQA
jgi:hypothetical protein